MTKRTIAAILLIAMLTFCGCNGKTQGGAQGDTSSATASTADTSGMDFDFTDRDTKGEYDASSAVAIDLSDSGSKVSGAGASVKDNTVTISSQGTYILSGTLTDGAVVVNAADTAKVQIVLDDAHITNRLGAAIYIKQADKVFITLASETDNSLADGTSYTQTDGDTTVDSALFSRADLTLNGSGNLDVKGNYKHAVVSKDDLVITAGKYTVTSQKVGLNGKDCVKISTADITVNAGSDGIRSDNEEDADRGYIYIQSGTLDITAQNDGLQAQSVLKVDNGTFKITSGGGSANSSYNSQTGGWNGGWNYGGYTQAEDAESAKGLKASSDIIISGGTFTVDSADDSIHSNGTISIGGGTFTMSSGDDGIHADTDLAISKGTLTVKKSYEGLEATNIIISGGNIDVTASDDGLNAAGGNDSSSMGDRPGMNGFSGSTGSITVSGGYMVIDALGDGVDSNGTLSVTGGVTLVSGPTNSGNGSLDYQSTAQITGGVFIALGTSGMAQNFTTAQNQGSILTSFTTQQGGTSFAVCDKSGKVIVSFTPAKAYQCAVVSAPDIKSGNSYTLVAGGAVKGADKNGFAQNTTLSGGTTVATVDMTTDIYGSGGGMGGGQPGGMPGGGGGHRPRW